MTEKEAKSCIGTIEMLRRLAYNIHGVMDVIDADNCEKIIKVLSDIPKYKDAYGKGWDDGAKATYEHLKMCEEEQEPKTGEWPQDLDGTYLCSECGSGFKEQPTLMGKPMFLWCPLCGARMVGDNNG